MVRGSGNRPKAPPPPASRPTARPPGERRLFFQKLRGSKRTVCAPQGQVGKWSRRRRGDEAKGGEGGAPLLSQVPALGSCPSVFNPLEGMGGTSKGEGVAPRQTPDGPRTCIHPTTQHRVLHPPEIRGSSGRRRHPRGGRGRRAQEGPSLRTAPLFVRSPTISSFPCPGC